MRKLSLTLFLLCMLKLSIGQQAITTFDVAYNQNFDGFGTSTFNLTDNSTTGFTGWYASRTTSNANPNPLVASTGTVTTGQFYNYGGGTTPPNTDRALGSIASSGTGTLYYGVRLKNNTGSTINYLSIKYTGEQWRSAGLTAQSMTVDYQIGTTVTSLTSGTWTNVPALTFTSPRLLSSATNTDGNNSINRTTNINTTLAVTINAGEEIFIRWVDIDNTGTDHALAIDDVSITAVTPTNWYYSGSGNFNTVSNWSSNANGVGGTNPTDFSSGVQIFNILDNPAGSITSISTAGMGNWDVTGNCRVNLGGNSANPITLTVVPSNDITGTFDISQSNTSTGNTLILQSTVPKLSALHETSTVEFAGSGSQTFPATNYGTLISSGSGARVINAAIGIAGTYTPGTNSYTLTGSTINFNGNSTQTIPTCTVENIRLSNNCNLPLGNTLTVSSGSTSFIVNSGVTFNVSGKILANYSVVSGSYFTLSGATFNMLSGSEFEVAADGGTIPTATWNVNSTLKVTGSVATLPTGRNQTFGNIIWNSPSQTAVHSLTGSAGSFNVTGTFTVENTGTGQLTIPGGTLVNVPVNNFTQNGGHVNILALGAPADRTLTVSGNFTLNGGTFVLANQSGFTGILNVAGNFTRTGGNFQRLDGIGRVVLNGTLPQTITGNVTFHNLVLNNSSGASITSGVGNTSTISSSLTITSGDLTTNDNLILSSNATSTARVANSAGSILGNVTVQRFLPGGRRAFRFLSHPFTSSLPVSSITDNIDITGIGGTPFTTTLTNNPSAFVYNNATANSSLSPDPGWVALEATNNFEALKGYRILIRGTKGEGLDGNVYTPSSVTLDWSGSLNQGTQAITLNNNGTNRDYNLIGNPYASPVDLSLVTLGSNINANFSVWDANIGSRGGYATQPFSSSYILPSGSAFFAQTTANTNNTITFLESSKASSSPVNLFRSNTADELLTLEVNTTTGNKEDKLQFIFNSNNYTSNYDALWDATKLVNPDVNFYSFSSNNVKLAIDRRPSSVQTIPLGFLAPAGNYIILVKDLPSTNEYLLKDNYTNTTTLLTSGTSISITVDANTASYGNARFELAIRANIALSNTFINVSASQKNNGIEVNFITSNEANVASYQVQKSTNARSFSKILALSANGTNNYSCFDASINQGDNYYRIKSIDKNGNITYSNTVKVKIGSKDSEFSIYPNPVKGNTINLQMMNIKKDTYNIKVVNSLGQQITSKQINHNGGSATQTISIGNVPVGKYNLLITNGTTIITKTVIVE